MISDSSLSYDPFPYLDTGRRKNIETLLEFGNPTPETKTNNEEGSWSEPKAISYNFPAT